MIQIHRTRAGAIDREWLLSLLPSAKRQDLLLSLVTTAFDLDRVAAAAWISPAILIEYTLGIGKLSRLEMAGLQAGLCAVDGIPPDANSLSRIAEYRPLVIEDGNELEMTSEGISLYPPEHPARAACEQLLTWERVPLELFYSALDVREAHRRDPALIREMTATHPRE